MKRNQKEVEALVERLKSEKYEKEKNWKVRNIEEEVSSVTQITVLTSEIQLFRVAGSAASISCYR